MLAFAAADRSAVTGMVGLAAKKLAGGPADGLLYDAPLTDWPKVIPRLATDTAKRIDERLKIILLDH